MHRALVLLLLFALPVAAQEDTDTEIAKRHFHLGSELYSAHHYAEALREFQGALVAKPLPALHYNIAKCFDRLERWDEAVVEYRKYLDDKSIDAAEAADVRKRIEELERRLEPKRAAALNESAGARTVAPPSLTAQPSVASAPPRRRWLWPLIGVGAAAVITAVVVIVLVATAKNHTSEGEASCRGCLTFP